MEYRERKDWIATIAKLPAAVRRVELGRLKTMMRLIDADPKEFYAKLKRCGLAS